MRGNRRSRAKKLMAENLDLFPRLRQSDIEPDHGRSVFLRSLPELFLQPHPRRSVFQRFNSGLHTGHQNVGRDMLEVPYVKRVDFGAVGFPRRLCMDCIKDRAAANAFGGSVFN